jgi:hypothetical protein
MVNWEPPKIIKDAAYHLHGYRNYLEFAVEIGPSDWDYEHWAENAFADRDDLEKMWDELTDAQKAEVKKLDDYLREHRKIFDESPVLLKYAIDGDAPKSHWWWYLPIENDES